MKFFSKKNKTEGELNSESDKQNQEEKPKKSSYVYAIIFILLLVMALINSFVGEKEEVVENTNIQKSEIIEKLNPLLSNNFEMDLIILVGSDLIIYNVKRENINKELIVKNYQNKSNTFYKEDNSLFEIVNNSLIESNEKVYNLYDTTFINIKNMIEVIENSSEELKLKEEGYYIKRLKTNIQSISNVYNEYNNTDLTFEDGKIIIDISYKDKEIMGIKMDLSDLYKSISEDFEKAIYYYEFKNSNQINLDSYIPAAE